MTISIKSIKTVISNFNSKGTVLLRKDQAQNVSQIAKEGLKAPQGSKTYDAVRVGRNYSPERCYTDIYTFKNESGEIINRYIKKVDDEKVADTHKGFFILENWEKDLDEFGDKVMQIFGKRVRSYTRENGKISKITEDFFAKTDENKPFLTHFKRETSPAHSIDYPKANIENIQLEERRHGQKTKFIKNKYLVDLYNPGSSRLLETKVSSPELEKVSQNTYFLPYVSNKHKFAYRMLNACIADAHFLFIEPDVSLFKSASKTAGYFSHNGEVHINLKSSKDLMRPRISLTETIGHEVGHAKWDEKTILYEFYKFHMDDGDFLRHYSESEIPDIKYYKYSVDNYVSPIDNAEGYHNQFCEKVARKEGTKAAKKYDDMDVMINKEFPNLHGFQFYDPNIEEDDLQGFMTLLQTLK